MPIKDINAIPINPVINIVIPSPLRPSGTLEYFNLSRIAAKAMIAKNQPIPEENP